VTTADCAQAPGLPAVHARSFGPEGPRDDASLRRHLRTNRCYEGVHNHLDQIGKPACIRSEEVQSSGGLLGSAFDDGVRRGFAAFASGFETGGGIDQRNVAEPLRKIAQLLAIIGVNFLREKPDIVLE
jgi:hypothetical protein